MHTLLTILLLAASALAGEPQVHRDLAYAEPKNERQTLDVYAPREGNNHPIVLWIHGGGWQSGDKSDVQVKPQAIVDKNFVFVSTNYRLLPDASIMQMGSDVAKAIRLVHDHAQEYGGDPNTFLVMGHSAGAQLAALVCTDDRYLKAENLSLSIIKGCVPVDGDTYDVPMQIATVEQRRKDAYRRKFGDEASQKALSPVTHVAKGRSIPPFLILHVAGHSETTAQSQRLANALLAAGVPARAYPAKGKNHGTINADLGKPDDEPTRELFKFVEGMLRRDRAISSGRQAPVEQDQDPHGRRIIKPFDYRGVTLHPGPLKRQVDEVRQFYLAIPDDDLLKGFRRRAGHPAPGKDLGGWYSSDTFLVFGQIVSSLARLYAATGDTASRDKANRLIKEWAKCIEPDGYFYASRKPNAPHYIYDKMLWGLLDVHAYCGNQAALAHLESITDWAIRNLDRKRRVNDTSTEWYTLSENLYRAYLATGKAKYRDFAEVWEYRDYWDIYANNGDIFAARPDGRRNESYHAYSHVNTLGGAGAAYLVTGNDYYLSVIRNAYEFLQGHECFATGGYGPDEQLLPRNRSLEKLGETHNSFETQCGSWAAFKMGKYLISFTGDAEYGDWIEQLVMNGISGSIPMTPDGRVFYYSDYNLHGGTKRNTDFGWSCCTGTRPQAVADYSDLVYFRDSEALYVNLFTPSAVAWNQRGVAVKLTQATSYPESDEVRLTLNLASPLEFAIKTRTPNWLEAKTEVRINGEIVDARSDDRHWTNLRRLWRNGDVISLRLPMKLRLSRLDPARPTPAAWLYGPVVLAFEAPNAKTLRVLDFTSMEHVLKPVAGDPLHFRPANAPNVLARPFASFREGQRYFVYLDPKMGRRIPHSVMTFRGRWNNAGGFRFSNEVGAFAEGEFEGTGVR
jgi:DUF1680 family protein/acetyl esterase/lipase